MPATNFNILTGLNVGNVTTDAAANSVATSGNITAGNLASTGLTSTASFTVSGNSNLGAVGNVTLTGGAANQVLITNGSGVLSFTNVNALVGTISSAVANQVTYYTAANTLSGSSNLTWNGANLLTVTGNVSASNFSTSGTLSVSGNANVGNLGATNANLSAATVTGNLATGNTSATLFTGNITGTSGVFSGNVTFGNINAVSGILGVSGNITGGNLITTGFLNVSGNANVGNIGAAAGVFTGNVSVTSNISAGNINSVSGILNVTGNANVGNLGATRGVFTNISGTLETAAQTNITSVGTLTSLAVTGNITSGNVSGTRGAFTNISGTLETAAQTNITSLGTLTSLTVSGNATFDTNTLFVDSVNNEVGIGTTSPLAILNTNAGTITGPAVTPGLMLTSFYSGVTAVNSIDWNYSGQSTSPVRLGATFNSGGAGMEMVFYTSTSYTTTGSERMRINMDGNVGVGTTSPGYRLHVVNSSDTSIAYYAIAKNDGGSADGFQIVDDRGFAGVNSGKTFRVVTRNDGTNDTGAIASFETIGGSTSTRMRINIDGNVGIGNSAPAHTLRVEGTFSATGNANVGNLGTSGNITASFFSGNGSQLTGITAASPTSVVNGTSNLVVTANGNVTTSVAGTANVLVVTSTGANVAGTVNVTGASYLATSSGNVGVGTASPGAKLTVIAGDSATASNQMILSGGRSLGAGADGSAGAILFTNSYWNSGYGAARISASDSGTSGGHLIFSTTANGGGVTGAPTEKMRILQNGNVGIGTSTPGALLSFGSGINDNKINLYEGTNDKYGFGIRANQLMIYSGAGGSGSGGITLGKFDGTTFTERMRVTNDGNVGIGNTAPTHTLRVEGTISATGNANVGNIGATSIVGTLTTASQTNITSLGTLTSLTVSGNISIGSLGVAIDSSKNFYPGNQTSNYFTWDGFGISKVGSGYFYISNGIFYVQSTSVFRGVVSNDQATYLQINGGTSGHTYFNGNVGVGISGPVARLQSAGATLTATPTGGSATGTGLYINGTDTTYGMMFGISSDGGGWIQQQRSDANNTQYALRLNPLGGFVGIGMGSTNPGKTLDIISAAGSIRLASTTSSGYGYIELGRSATATNNWHFGSENDGTFRFYNGNFGAGALRLYMTSAGETVINGGGGGLTIINNNPTITFQDTDGRSAFIHCNANLLYFLRGSGSNVGYGSWTSVNAAWPLTINLEDNTATFGGVVTTTGTNSRFATGYDSGVNNSMSCSNWFRSNGSTGWYNATYDGGIWMADSTYVRVFNGKGFLVDGSHVANGQISARYGQSSGSVANASGGLGGVEIYGGGSTNAAFLTFHRPGAYAVYFGLDGTDLKVGGWSMGAVAYTMLNENNWTSYTSSKNVQLNSLGVGVAASGTAGQIVATGKIYGSGTSYRMVLPVGTNYWAT